MTSRHLVRASALPALRGAVEGLNRRASRLGCPPVTLEVVELTEREVGEDPLGRPVTVQVAEVAISGESPRLAGWRLVAVVEPHEAGNVLRVVPTEICPVRYYEAELTCDHCRTRRHRKATYVVCHEDGHHEQVGSGCLRDFLGGADPAALVDALESGLTLGASLAGEDWSPCRGERSWDPVTVLQLAATAIRKWGWVSRGAGRDDPTARPTADAVWEILVDSEDRSRWGAAAREIIAGAGPEEERVARAALAWAREGGAGDADYGRNLRIAALDERCRPGSIGLLCSAVPGYRRSAEVAAEGARSRHLGAVKGRIEVAGTLAAVRSYDGSWGTRHWHRLVTDDGYVVAWYGSSLLRQSAGDRVTVRGTVKAHEEKDGVKVTRLTRVKEVSP